jgi:hypothetical protein
VIREGTDRSRVRASATAPESSKVDTRPVTVDAGRVETQPRWPRVEPARRTTVTAPVSVETEESGAFTVPMRADDRSVTVGPGPPRTIPDARRVDGRPGAVDTGRPTSLIDPMRIVLAPVAPEDRAGRARLEAVSVVTRRVSVDVGRVFALLGRSSTPGGSVSVLGDPGSVLGDPGSALGDPGSALGDPGSALGDRSSVAGGRGSAVIRAMSTVWDAGRARRASFSTDKRPIPSSLQFCRSAKMRRALRPAGTARGE